MPGLVAVPCDVSDQTQVDMLFAALAQELGGLDVLVANVGIGGPTLPADELPLADWQRVMDVNLTGTFDVTRRRFLAQGEQGHDRRHVFGGGAPRLSQSHALCRVQMGTGRHGQDRWRPNSASSASARTRSCRRAVGGERFERVIEGRAALSGRAFEDEMMAGFGNQSLKQVVEPAHVADLVHFLTTPAGWSISGAALPIDNDLHRG